MLFIPSKPPSFFAEPRLPAIPLYHKAAAFNKYCRRPAGHLAGMPASLWLRVGPCAGLSARGLHPPRRMGRGVSIYTKFLIFTRYICTDFISFS